jgi:hypothetical protein
MSGEVELTVNDVGGKTRISIPVDKLSRGLYIAILSNDRGEQVRLKFMKL